MGQENLTLETPVTETEATTPAAEPRLPRPAPRKKRWGDRKDGRRVRTAQPMAKMMAFIMKDRADAMNYFTDELDVTETDVFCKKMIADGYEGFSFLHIMLAAYVRVISQKPALNRFISGQRIYARNNIEVNMTIKKDLREDSPDTCISVIFEPDDTIIDVYEKFNAAVQKEKDKEDLDSGFDKTAGTLASLPRPILRAAIRLLFWLDYHGWLPKALTDLSPFHGSMIITDLGSLGLNPIYHHIYNFGSTSLFFGMGTQERIAVVEGGQTRMKRFLPIGITADERVCSGAHYAQFFGTMNYLLNHPEELEVPPESVRFDPKCEYHVPKVKKAEKLTEGESKTA